MTCYRHYHELGSCYLFLLVLKSQHVFLLQEASNITSGKFSILCNLYSFYTFHLVTIPLTPWVWVVKFTILATSQPASLLEQKLPCRGWYWTSQSDCSLPLQWLNRMISFPLHLDLCPHHKSSDIHAIIHQMSVPVMYNPTYCTYVWLQYVGNWIFLPPRCKAPQMQQMTKHPPCLLAWKLMHINEP